MGRKDRPGLDPDLDAAFGRSLRAQRALRAYTLIVASTLVGHAWLISRGEDGGNLGDALNLVVVLGFLLPSFGGDDQWIAALLRRARAVGGVGAAWVARDRSVRRWHRLDRASALAVVVVLLAIIPVTHRIYLTAGHPRTEIELCISAADFALYAVSAALCFPRIGRRCFEAARAALLAAEAAAAQEPVAGTATG